jgi:hypothetical protein
MRNIEILKQFIKETAKQIRTVRYQYKEAQRCSCTTISNKLLLQLLSLQYTCRHHHIAYCELRGKTRVQIEPKNREHHEPNESYIKQLKEQYAWTPEEIKTYEEKHAKALYINPA